MFHRNGNAAGFTPLLDKERKTCSNRAVTVNLSEIYQKESENVMKKILIATAILTLFLCGCQSNKNTDMSDYGDDISKAQEITVVSADTSEVIDTITSKEDIEAFVAALDMDEWKLKALPEEATEIGSF